MVKSGSPTGTDQLTTNLISIEELQMSDDSQNIMSLLTARDIARKAANNGLISVLFEIGIIDDMHLLNIDSDRVVFRLGAIFHVESVNLAPDGVRQLDGYGSQQEQDGIKLLITEVYRGKPLSGSVLQQLIDNKDGLISMNGFLSTTLNSDVVGVYAGDEKIADGYRRAKFQLQISKKIRQPYAYIGNCSTKKDELEVLFSIGTIWRIESIKYDEDPCTIELTSCDELDSQLMELLEKYTGDGCTLLTLGDILWELGEDLEAEYFYQKMLEESTLSNELRGALHYRIGMIRFNRKDYSIALDNLKEVESLFESSNNELNKVGLFHPLYMSGNRPPFVTIYNNMGIMLENDGKTGHSTQSSWSPIFSS
ncbi:unnamed protein product [Rotaria sordida]|uniref:Uncharacterized protein n=1 Tax=Rotaria sordida TaxID=392033 RepID=A0A815E034_9BILA|nr:unnamed protein product [Rotaria sordida]CAF1573849.1 unnamed protein product [Rotaria sordida]